MSLKNVGKCLTPTRVPAVPGAVRPRSYDPPNPRLERRLRAVTGTREAEELLLIEEADAWFEYLEATHAQSAVRYREVEPWAWARLQQRMRAIKARRTKLRPAAA